MDHKPRKIVNDLRLISLETNLAYYKEEFSYLHSTKLEQMTKTMVIFKRGAIFLCCIRCDPIPPQTSVQRLAHTRNVTTCCSPCHGPTKTSKVWVQTNISFSQGSDLISWPEIPSVQWTPWWPFRNVRLKLLSLAGDYNSSFCIPRRNSSESKYQDIAWLWKLTSWACYRGCCAKGKKSWRCCLVGKYVRYTKMTPVIYFSPQTLNNKEFYYANLIFQKRGLS